MMALGTLMFGIAGTVLVGSPVAAQAVQQLAVKTPVRTQLDPGEVICQRLTVVGSRIDSKRYCMTRLQWQEQRTGDREFTEKVQSTLQLRDGG
jgi:hypothetical protein